MSQFDEDVFATRCMAVLCLLGIVAAVFLCCVISNQLKDVNKKADRFSDRLDLIQSQTTLCYPLDTVSQNAY